MDNSTKETSSSVNESAVGSSSSTSSGGVEDTNRSAKQQQQPLSNGGGEPKTNGISPSMTNGSTDTPSNSNGTVSTPPAANNGSFRKSNLFQQIRVNSNAYYYFSFNNPTLEFENLLFKEFSLLIFIIKI